MAAENEGDEMKMRQPRAVRMFLACAMLAAVLFQASARAQRPPRPDPAPLATFTAEQAVAGRMLAQ